MNDDDLRARLRALDPSASLSPADPERLARLLEDTMSHDPHTPESDDDAPAAAADNGSRARSPLTWLVAAAAVLLIASVGVWSLTSGDDPAGPGTAAPGSASAGSDDGSGVLALSARPPSSAKCMVPNATVLSAQEVGFDGTVTAITDDQVTLEVSHWYHGGKAEQVTVTAPAADLTALVQAVQFEAGQRYLVSATDGYVTVCGFSGPYTEELAALYAEAF